MFKASFWLLGTLGTLYMVPSGGPFGKYYTLSHQLLSCPTLLGEWPPPLTYKHTHSSVLTCTDEVVSLLHFSILPFFVRNKWNYSYMPWKPRFWVISPCIGLPEKSYFCSQTEYNSTHSSHCTQWADLWSLWVVFYHPESVPYEMKINHSDALRV